MSSDSNTTISHREIALPANAASLLFQKQLRQIKSGALLIFSIATFFGIGLAGLLERFAVMDSSPLVTLSIATGFGISTSVGMSLLQFSDWPAVVAELRTGRCLEVTVNCSRTTKVRFRGSSLEGIAFACESQVLLLIGDWQDLLSKDEPAEEAAAQHSFPPTKFRIWLLPESGRVLDLFVEGARLAVHEPDGGGKLLSLKFSKYAEAVYLPRRLDSLTA